MRKRKSAKNKFFDFLVRNKENIVNLIVILIIWGFLLSYFKPSLILSGTTLSGGDTPSHNYLVKYLRDYLLPRGRVIGWSPGWWAGFPMFQFYFFFPYMMAALLSYIIPMEIAFKIVTVSGPFLLPLTAFFGLKKMKSEFPIPILGSVFMLPFLFLEKNSMWGGNIPSLLAGEISVSISIAFFILFMGLLYRDVERGKMSLWTPIVFSLVIFTHLTTAMLAGTSAIFFLITKNKKTFTKNFKLLFKIFLITFLITAFWTLPMIYKIPYSVGFGEDWNINIFDTFPTEALIYFGLGIFGVMFGVKNLVEKKDKKILYICFMFLLSLFLFFNAYHFNLVNIRFWPFLYLIPLILAAFGLGNIIKNVKGNWILVIVIVILMIWWTNESTAYIDHWIEWNYSGFESKTTWPVYREIYETLKDTTGRAANDLADINNQFGSPRCFESLPYFANKPVIEGGIVQSGLSSIFTYYIQCEDSHHCAGYPRIVTPTSYNLTAATEHLKLYNVKYFVAIWDQVKKDLNKSSEWNLVKKIKDYEIYELTTNNGKYIYVPENVPNLMKKDDWKIKSFNWYRDINNLDTPIVFVKKPDKESQERFSIRISDLSELKKQKINNNCTIREEIKNEEIKFTTNCIGKPHIIKISYFPNWKVEGADKIYLVSPDFMLVYPNQKNVRIYYGWIWIDILSTILSVIGICIVLVYPFRKRMGVVI